jgi:hypothetical protein
MLAKIARDTLARNSTDPGADLLNRDHQRIAEEHGPRDREAELRAGLAIRADPARIVVGCSGDEPGSKHP